MDKYVGRWLKPLSTDYFVRERPHCCDSRSVRLVRETAGLPSVAVNFNVSKGNHFTTSHVLTKLLLFMRSRILCQEDEGSCRTSWGRETVGWPTARSQINLPVVTSEVPLDWGTWRTNMTGQRGIGDQRGCAGIAHVILQQSHGWLPVNFLLKNTCWKYLCSGS